MCLDDAFRLCSCDAANLKDKDVGWTLLVVDESKEMLHRKGKVKMPRFSTDDMRTVESVVAQLNARNCFDFALSPSGDYALRLRFDAGKPDNEWLKFRRCTGVWAHDTASPLAGWRTQLVRAGQGTIAPAAASETVVVADALAAATLAAGPSASHAQPPTPPQLRATMAAFCAEHGLHAASGGAIDWERLDDGELRGLSIETLQAKGVPADSAARIVAKLRGVCKKQ